MKKVMQGSIKNFMLLSTPVLAQLPALFIGDDSRLNLGLLVERSTRIDFFTRYYATIISFLILTYCLKYPKDIDKRVINFILIISVLDVFHLTLFSMRGFGMAKIGIAAVILFVYDYIKKHGKT